MMPAIQYETINNLSATQPQTKGTMYQVFHVEKKIIKGIQVKNNNNTVKDTLGERETGQSYLR